MLANAMRGLGAEFGLTVPQGIGRLEELLALVDADKAFAEKARQVFAGLYDQCRARWLQVSGHSKWRLLLTHGKMKLHAA
jgi:hypothetical protein